ncbi:DUF3574 domain-containing protein [Phenylobacterium sp. VNQ135]|uniref:DUF3574 domain-containing protein n=1 Tax=Phenylobacterium sp. VNQ135 TaxID=3400922 RepID=UPI003C0E9EF2
MRLAGAVVLAMAVAGCATAPAPSCPAGQEHMRTAQLFLGGAPRGAGGGSRVREADIRTFVDQEITPRFPNGVTVLDGGGQWRGDENRLIREAQKVVLIVLPPARGAQDRLDAVRSAYRARFKQDAVLVTQAACVAV